MRCGTEVRCLGRDPLFGFFLFFGMFLLNQSGQCVLRNLGRLAVEIHLTLILAVGCSIEPTTGEWQTCKDSLEKSDISSAFTARAWIVDPGSKLVFPV
jgi:hypothetical protein